MKKSVKQRDMVILDKLVENGLPMHMTMKIEASIRDGSFTFDGLRKTILQNMARTAYSYWWIDEQERKREDTGKKLPWGPGAQLEDYIPKKTPSSANVWAKKVLSMFEAETKLPAEALYWIAENVPGRHTRVPTPEEFGKDLAMMAEGTGVSWFDNHPDFEPLYSADVHHQYYQ